MQACRVDWDPAGINQGLCPAGWRSRLSICCLTAMGEVPPQVNLARSRQQWKQKQPCTQQEQQRGIPHGSEAAEAVAQAYQADRDPAGTNRESCPGGPECRFVASLPREMPVEVKQAAVGARAAVQAARAAAGASPPWQ